MHDTTHSDSDPVFDAMVRQVVRLRSTRKFHFGIAQLVVGAVLIIIAIEATFAGRPLSGLVVFACGVLAIVILTSGRLSRYAPRYVERYSDIPMDIPRARQLDVARAARAWRLDQRHTTPGIDAIKRRTLIVFLLRMLLLTAMIAAYVTLNFAQQRAFYAENGRPPYVEPVAIEDYPPSYRAPPSRWTRIFGSRTAPPPEAPALPTVGPVVSEVETPRPEPRQIFLVRHSDRRFYEFGP